MHTTAAPLEVTKVRRRRFYQAVTAAHEFKAFLWRHPEIHGMSRTEVLMSEIKDTIASIGKRFINDGQPHHSGLVSPDTLTCLKLTVQAALDKLVAEHRIQNFDVHDNLQPTGFGDSIEVVIQPTLSVERIVVDMTLNP